MLSKQGMITLYKHGRSLAYITNNYKTEISRTQLHREVKKLGINRNISQSHIKYEIDDTYFENIDNQDKAYWLGFMFADGCVWKSGINVFTEIKETSYGIAEICGLSVCNVKMVNDLIKLGCTPKKSLTLKFPRIRKDLINHFIRGYFDGDGTLTYSNKEHTVFNIKICGTKEFLLSIAKHFNIDTNKYLWHDNRFEKSKNIYVLGIGKYKDLENFLDSIYNNANIKLDRKYERYLEYKQIYSYT